MNWDILGIQPTTDKDIIKEAYMNKLSQINPEDDEEGFKRLRKAYEELLLECKNETYEDNSDTGKWIKKVSKVYNTFSCRISEDSWKELLDDDVCYGLDTKEEASEKLLEFLMDNCYISQKIWCLLNDFFDWMHNKEELYENFPKEYINYVENRIKYKDIIDFDLFESIDDSKSYETWINLFFKIRRELGDKDFDNAKVDLETITELNIYHPYLETLKMRYLMDCDEKEKALEIGNNLLEKYPDDIRVLFEQAEVKWLLHRIEEAKELYEKILSTSPEHYNALLGLADCDFYLENYEDAKERYIKLNGINMYDDYVNNQLYKTNEKIIEKNLNMDDLSLDQKFNLGWCLFENYRFDEIIELLKDINITKEFENQFYDLMGRTYSELGNYEYAIDYFDKWKNNLLNLEEKNSRETAQLSFCLYKIGCQYYMLERYDEAINSYNESLEIDEKNIDALNYKGEVLYKLGKYEESIASLDKALEFDDSFMPLYLNKAKALFELGYHGDSLDSCFEAENLYSYDPDVYALEMKLYLAHSEYDNVLEVYEKAKNYNVVNDEINLYKAKALSNTEKYEDAKKLVIEVLKNIRKNGDTYKIEDELYYEFSLIYSDTDNPEMAMKYIKMAMKISDKIKFHYAIAYYYKCLGINDMAFKEYDILIEKFPKDVTAYIQEAQLYKKLYDEDKSIELYKKVLDINPDHEYANGEIALLYTEKQDYNNAFKYYRRQFDINKEPYYLISRGILFDDLGKFDKAISDYKEVLEINPNDSDAYNNLGNVYKEQGKYEEAVKYLKKAIDNMGDNVYIQAYNNLADCYVCLKRYDEAINCYDEAIDYFPDNQKLYQDKNKIYELIKKGDNEEYLYEKIRADYLEFNNYDERELIYEKAIQKECDGCDYTNCGEAHAKMGKMAEHNKEYDLALKYYIKANDLEEGDDEYQEAIDRVKNILKGGELR